MWSSQTHVAMKLRVALALLAAGMMSGCELLGLDSRELDVAIVPHELVLTVGDTARLSYSLTPVRADAYYSRYESANPAIAATVFPDRVAGNQPGRTTITLHVWNSDGWSGTDRITVDVVAR